MRIHKLPSLSQSLVGFCSAKQERFHQHIYFTLHWEMNVFSHSLPQSRKEGNLLSDCERQVSSMEKMAYELDPTDSSQRWLE